MTTPTIRRRRRPGTTATRTFARACRRITLAASLATASLCSPTRAAPPDAAAAPAAASARVAAIELRGEARVNDANVTLRQLCRWPAADEQALAPYADLIVLRLTGGVGSIAIEQLQSMLADAGLNPGRVNFAGATACAVSRADVADDDAAALRAYAGDAPTATAAKLDDAPRATLSAPVDATAAAADVQDLRSLLIADVAQRLKLPIDTLQIDFRPEDRATLSLAAPFEFSIQPQRYGDLGETSWLITITGRGGQKVVATNVGDGKRLRITANARAWMEQVVATHALATREPIDAADVESKRVLIDRMPPDPWVTRQQAVGQQTARDVRPGMVLSSRLVTPVDLVRPGQLVTVFMRRGSIEVKSVARAMQNGSAGQTVKLKNESTGETYLATVTAKQTAVIDAGGVADVH